MASVGLKTKQPSDVCRSMRALVLSDNGWVPVSEERRSAGGALGGEYAMAISEVSDLLFLLNHLG